MVDVEVLSYVLVLSGMVVVILVLLVLLVETHLPSVQTITAFAAPIERRISVMSRIVPVIVFLQCIFLSVFYNADAI